MQLGKLIRRFGEENIILDDVDNKTLYDGYLTFTERKKREKIWEYADCNVEIMGLLPHIPNKDELIIKVWVRKMKEVDGN